MDFSIFSLLISRKHQSFNILICQQIFFLFVCENQLKHFHDQLSCQLLKVPRSTIHHNR